MADAADEPTTTTPPPRTTTTPRPTTTSKPDSTPNVLADVDRAATASDPTDHVPGVTSPPPAPQPIGLTKDDLTEALVAAMRTVMSPPGMGYVAPGYSQPQPAASPYGFEAQAAGSPDTRMISAFGTPEAAEAAAASGDVIERRMSFSDLEAVVMAVDLVHRYHNERQRATVLPIAVQLGLVPPPPPVMIDPYTQQPVRMADDHPHVVATNRLYQLLSDIPGPNREW